MLKLKLGILSLAFFFCSTVLTAQHELSLGMMHHLDQSSLINPSFQQNCQFTIGIPSVYFNFYNGPFSFNDVITVDGDTARVNLPGLLTNIKEDNRLRLNSSIQPLYLRAQLASNLQMTFGYAFKSYLYGDYNEALIRTIVDGNTQYLNQTVDLGLSFNMAAYHEVGVGLSLELFEDFRIGGRVKWLSGIVGVNTPKHSISMYTDSTSFYPIEATTDYRLNTSGVFENYNSFIQPSFEDFAKNSGFGFDLGASYNFMDKLHLAVSLLDIGSINWTANNENFTSQGTYTYEGLDVLDFIRSDTFEVINFLDTLEERFGMVESNEEFDTPLPRKLYLSGMYQVTDQLEAGGQFYTEFFQGNSEVAISLGANYKISPALRLGAAYSIRNNKFDNLGINAVINTGFLTVYFVTDNITALVRPYDSRNFNFRAGLNLCFGDQGAELTEAGY